LFPYSSSHPGIRDWLGRLHCAYPVVERAKIHIIDLQRNSWTIRFQLGDPRHGTLAMNTFLAKTVIRRQFNLYRYDLTD